ncbi:MAG TPA: hypothetical protein VFB78_09020 [Acidimicrobiales bacterium]|nr:hypothetical protein [Acidimicrobiales bacterium]
MAVSSGSKAGLTADPNAPDSLLIAFYSRPGYSPYELTTGDAFFEHGGIALQMRVGRKGADKNLLPDRNLKDDGHTREYVTVRNRRAVLEHTTDPPTGVNGFTLWWTTPIPGDDKRAVVVEVLTSSVAVDRDALFAFVEGLAGP